MSVIKTDLDLSNFFGEFIYDCYITGVEFINIHPDYSLLKFRDILSDLVASIADRSKVEVSTQRLFDQIDYLHDCQIISWSLKGRLHEARKLGNLGAHKEYSQTKDVQFSKDRKHALIQKANHARDLILEIFVDALVLYGYSQPVENIERIAVKVQEYKEVIFRALTSNDKRDKLQAGIILENIAEESMPVDSLVVSSALLFHYESIYKVAASFYEAAYKISANVDGRFSSLALKGESTSELAVTRKYGDLEPLFRFSVLQSEGRLGEDQKEAGHELMKVAADRGYAQAQAFCGAYLYFEGRYEESRYYLEEAEKQDEPVALSTLFKYFIEGKACNQNVDKALSYINRGIEIGCPNCVSELGEAYHQGVGLPKDDEKAEELLLKAIDAGSTKAKIYYKFKFNDLAGQMADHFAEIGRQMLQASKASKTQKKNENKKIGVNEQCPCGSGKKYKKCCRGKTLGFTLADI